MQLLRTNSLLGATLPIALVILSTPSSACVCTEKSSLISCIESGHTTGAIVKGRVIKKLVEGKESEGGRDKNTDNVLSGIIDFAEKRYLVKVHKAFKGCDISTSDFIVVRTGASNTLCGMNMTVGKTYVWSSKQVKTEDIDTKWIPKKAEITGELSVNSCGWNSEWSHVPDTERLRLIAKEHWKVCGTASLDDPGEISELDLVEDSVRLDEILQVNDSSDTVLPRDSPGIPVPTEGSMVATSRDALVENRRSPLQGVSRIVDHVVYHGRD